MEKHDCKNMIFSSTACVYGCGENLTENSPLNPTHTYSKSKITIEYMMESMSFSKKDWSLIVLRYFNPVGAHQSGLIGDSPTVFPNNLFPFIE